MTYIPCGITPEIEVGFSHTGVVGAAVNRRLSLAINNTRISIECPLGRCAAIKILDTIIIIRNIRYTVTWIPFDMNVGGRDICLTWARLESKFANPRLKAVCKGNERIRETALNCLLPAAT
jgi:hypothetical protein